MSSFSRSASADYAGGPCSHHGDLPGPGRRSRLRTQYIFETAMGIYSALYMAAADELVQAGLLVADTRPDITHKSGIGLVGHSGRPAAAWPASPCRHAGAQGVLGQVGISQFADSDHRDLLAGIGFNIFFRKIVFYHFGDGRKSPAAWPRWMRQPPVVVSIPGRHRRYPHPL